MIGVLLGALALGIGFLFLAHSHWHGLRIDHEVKPLDIATLWVNISIAVILQYFFTSKAVNSRAEKDLIIEDIRSVIGIVRESNDQFLKRLETTAVSLEGWRIAVGQCRSISNGLEAVEFALGETRCKKCNALKNRSAALREKFFVYKQTLTDSPVHTDGGRGLSRQSTAYRALLRALQSTAFEVNSH